MKLYKKEQGEMDLIVIGIKQFWTMVRSMF